MKRFDKISAIAATCLAAIVLFQGCSPKEEEPIDFSVTPVQTVDSMVVLRADNGNASMRMTAPLMERYAYRADSVDVSFELYKGGFNVYAYTADGELETTIVAQEARHNTASDAESWCAYGDVVIINHLEGQKIETDTLYWNREEQSIYTDCYVKLTSYSGMMQGYGMTSDERARNSIILKPFDSYSVARDSGDVYVDTVNILGPRR
ncbi:MAG: LPS export ABC transporter periplasmic protein LptC [Bacteroidales bacterium]|nr:LPS export ABC transporter periplasmic protein LptC [Candidatus Cacconaster equifaecalis]